MGKRVEYVELFVIFGVDHRMSLQRIDIARITYHKSRSSAREIITIF
jgi:hypothetical protein